MVLDSSAVRGYRVAYTLSDIARLGDHVWWISDVRRFQHDYPSWSYTYNLRAIVNDLIEAARERFNWERRDDLFVGVNPRLLINSVDR